MLRERLSQMSDVSIRITETLALDAVLQGVMDGACSLTGARRGCVTALGRRGAAAHLHHLRHDPRGAPAVVRPARRALDIQTP